VSIDECVLHTEDHCDSQQLSVKSTNHQRHTHHRTCTSHICRRCYFLTAFQQSLPNAPDDICDSHQNCENETKIQRMWTYITDH